LKTVIPSASPTLNAQLTSLYEEIMWLRGRPNITSSVARSWYTHACAERFKKHVRRFTGRISKSSVDPEAKLQLEHHLRIQTSLTSLVEKHHTGNLRDPADFIDTVIKFEEVHIVTSAENYSARRAKGDYSLAGIELVDFHSLSIEDQSRLWRLMLLGRVANHADFNPNNKKPNKSEQATPMKPSD